MGSTSSKTDQQPPPDWHKDHAPLPPETVPYPGPRVQHHIIEVNINLKGHMKFRGSKITSNIDEYYPALGAEYGDGFTLISFYRIPFGRRSAGFFSMAVAVPFQGIFSRCPSAPTHERWQLTIEKSTMFIQAVANMRMRGGAPVDMSADTSHLVEVISRCAADGGRLICLEMTNLRLTQRGMTTVEGDVGVDLFFNMPQHPNPTMYIYQCVHTPIPITVSPGFTMPTVDIQFNFMAHLAAHLNQGYRLVEIFYDQSALTRMQGVVMPFKGMSMNAIWFFEKEADRMEDNTPIYEGCIVEYYLKIKGGFNKVTAAANWGHLLEEMGNKGWQLACTLETPKMVRAGMRTAKQTILLFFQRKLLAPNSASGVSVYPADVHTGKSAAPGS